MIPKIIKINNISKVYNNNKSDIKTKACSDINLNIYKGEFLSIIGESGSGKSTLVKILSNLEKPSSGEVLYNDLDISSLNAKQLRAHRQNIQLVFQDTTSSLNPKMSIQNIICEPLINFKLIKKSNSREVASEFLKKVELDDSFLSKKPQEMSGGQRQRINIARALTLNPEVLILDEPTSALDVITQTKILKLIKKLQVDKNITIIFVCHDIALVTKISDRIAVMHKGELKEVIAPNNLQKDFLDEYTLELFNSVFDIKKCECKFDDICEHEPNYK
ncbi:MAG: dipeptide/oligopeptide/nickel ABC transporter ATP-binding protein [bacterium]